MPHHAATQGLICTQAMAALPFVILKETPAPSCPGPPRGCRAAPRQLRQRQTAPARRRRPPGTSHLRLQPLVCNVAASSTVGLLPLVRRLQPLIVVRRRPPPARAVPPAARQPPDRRARAWCGKPQSLQRWPRRPAVPRSLIGIQAAWPLLKSAAPPRTETRVPAPRGTSGELRRS